MINKIRNSNSALFIFVFLLSLNLKSQIPPNNCPPVIFTGTFTSGTQTNAACNVELNGLSVTNAANYDVKARYSIHVPPGNFNLVSSLTTGSFHAHIEAAPFEVVSYHSNGFNGIPQYDKFELGIKLPQDLTDEINNFFSFENKVRMITSPPPLPAYSTATTYIVPNGYGNVFDPNFLNPYDPDKISVEATFHFPGKPDQVVYGFYYREYIDYSIVNPVPSYTNSNWVEDFGLQYHWRIRFTPKYVGLYKITWKIKTNYGNTIAYEDNVGQSFNAIPSLDKGFIKLGNNGKFLVTQPNDPGPQKSIIPIGVGDAYPQEGIPLNPEDNIPTNECSSYGCNLPWGNNPYNYSYPSRFWRHRENIKNNVAMNGGNIVRVFSSPDSYDIEWEKSGVYDADPQKPLGNYVGYTYTMAAQTYYKGCNRQAILWEFDRLLDMAKANNLYVQWVTDDSNVNGYKQDPGANFPLQSNPYFGIVSSTEELFTNATAKKLYKNKLRYLIARYGYSTNLCAFELLNELHNLKTDIPGNTLDNIIKPWLEEMISYIKDPYPSLNHNDHLFTVSLENCCTASNVGKAIGLDFVSEHPYIDDNGACVTILINTQAISALSYSKPCQPGELGIRSGWSCLGPPLPANKVLFPEYMAPSFHSILWSSTFVGGLTSGLNNWAAGGYNNTDVHVCGDIITNHFKPLQTFINDVNYSNYDQQNFVPKYSPPNPFVGNPFTEAFYLVNNNGIGNRALGYARNITFNWNSFRNPNSGTFYDIGLVNQVNAVSWQAPLCAAPLAPQQVANGFLGFVNIAGLLPGYYVIDWYETYTDPPQLIGSYTLQSAFIFPTGLILTSPVPVFIANDCERQEYAFKVHPLGQMKSNQNASDSVLTIYADSAAGVNFQPQPLKSYNSATPNLNTNATINNCIIYPNPGTGIYYVNMSKEGNYLVEIINSYGAKIKSISFKGKLQEINIENLKAGLYTFTIKGDESTYAQKIIKE